MKKWVNLLVFAFLLPMAVSVFADEDGNELGQGEQGIQLVNEAADADGAEQKQLDKKIEIEESPEPVVLKAILN